MTAAPPLPALELARTPRGVRRLALLVGLFFLLAIPVLLLAPWTQTVHGTGRAIAFNPVLRPQPVVSPIQGRVMSWHGLKEGDKVTAGQRLVSLVDNDPLRLERLRDALLMADQRRTYAANSVADQRARLANIRAERPSLIASARARVDAARTQVLRAGESVIRERAVLMREEFQLARERRMFNTPGLAPGAVTAKATVEEAERREAVAKQLVEIALADKSIAEKLVVSAEEDFKAVEERTSGAVKTDEQLLNARLGEQAATEQAYLQAKTEVERQENQAVVAPVAGTLFRILANGEAGGQLVNPGTQLAVLVPDLPAAGGLTRPGDPGICAELVIDGNDLPLVRAGDRVLVQFEGWAAVQFASYPEAAAGTFEGRVFLVDPTSDGQGRFRILVEPAPGERPWPDTEYLRQGVRAQGWVLAQTVPVGYELWRLLNGFPPAREVKAKVSRAPFGPVDKK